MRKVRSELEIIKSWKGVLKRPKVSICCMTYNHQDYIHDAINGFLDQITTFPIEIIIHDDASDDDTGKIVAEYKEKYPKLIVKMLQAENQYSKGIKPFVKYVWNRAVGKYIALCEGDDYWTDPLKLEKQVSFLEENPKYVMCYHNAIVVDEAGRKISDSKLAADLQRDYTEKELMNGACALTLTLCFRNIISELPDDINKVLNGDTFLTSLLGQYGAGKYMPEIGKAVYRKHYSSVWSSLDSNSADIHSANTYAYMSKYYKRIQVIDTAVHFQKSFLLVINSLMSRVRSTDNPDVASKLRQLLAKHNDLLEMSSVDPPIEEVTNGCHFRRNSHKEYKLQVNQSDANAFPKFTFIIIVLNGMPFVEYAIKAIYNFAHQIIIVEGAVELAMFMANSDGSSKDGTIETIKRFPDPYERIRLIQGQWPEKVYMQNRALLEATGDYIWLVDSDEIYHEYDILKVREMIRNDPSITQVNFIGDNFWKGFDYIFVSQKFFEPSAHWRRVFKVVKGSVFSTHRPPTLIWPGEKISTEQMHLIDGDLTRKLSIIPCHYSYVFDIQVRQKIKLYERYGWGNIWGTNLIEWYMECFKKWTPENRKLIEEKYGIWTGDRNSHTEKYSGEHPEVMKQYIEKVRGVLRKSKDDGVTQDRVRQIISEPENQEEILKGYGTMEVDDPIRQRKDTIQDKKKIKVAADYVKDGAKIGEESQFRKELERLFSVHRFHKIIETGTYLGTGTTTIIATALRDLGIRNPKFYSIEINPLHLQAAVNHLRKSGLIDYVTLLNGLSVPKKMLPSMEEIERKYVKDIDFDDIFIDHKESERALLYYQETDFEGLPDDQLREALKSFNYEPDFLLLDSGGHMGNVEFNYLINLLRGECYIALDDIHHIKHHKSFLQIKEDPRFNVVAESSEKFGFCIAKFSPAIAANNGKIKSILWVRTDNIGDNILSASMLPYVRDKFEQAKITVVCQEVAAELYEGCPFVNEIVGVNKQRAYQDEAYRNDIVRELNGLNPDLALNSVYSREPITDLLAIAPKAMERIAFSGNLCNISRKIRDGHDPLYSKLLTSDKQHKLEIERHRDFLAGIGIESVDLSPLVWTTDEDEAFADELFRKKGLIPEKTIALFAGVQDTVRSYNRYGFALARVFGDSEFAVVGLGSKDDFMANEENLATSEMTAINLSGKTSLRQTAALLKRCRLAVGAETGLAHMACAVGTPNVILLGGGHFGRFMPYSSLTTVVCLPLGCYGCDWKCKYRRVYCVRNVRDDVFAMGIREALSRMDENPRVVVQGKSHWSVLNGMPKWESFEKVLDPKNVTVVEVEKRDIQCENEIIGEYDRSGIISRKSTNEDVEKPQAGRKMERSNVFTSDMRNAEVKKGNGRMESSISTFASNHVDDEFRRYKSAAEWNPNDPICQKNLADFYYVMKGDVDSALEHYSRALSSNPKDINTLLMIGHISVSKGRFDEADVFYGKVLKIDPFNKDAREKRNAIQKMQYNELTKDIQNKESEYGISS